MISHSRATAKRRQIGSTVVTGQDDWDAPGRKGRSPGLPIAGVSRPASSGVTSGTRAGLLDDRAAPHSAVIYLCSH